MAKTKYRPDFPKLAEMYAKEGMIDVDIAKRLGISIDTYYKYQKRYPEFSESLKRGKAPVDQGVENALLKRAMGFEYEEVTVEYAPPAEPGQKPVAKNIKKAKKLVIPDVTADIFWLKNRMPKRWRDKQDVDVRIRDMSVADLKESIKKGYDEHGS